MLDVSRLLTQFIMTLNEHRDTQLIKTDMDNTAMLGVIHNELSEFRSRLHEAMKALELKIDCSQIDKIFDDTKKNYQEIFKGRNIEASSHLVNMLMTEYFKRLRNFAHLFHLNLEKNEEAIKEKKRTQTDQLNSRIYRDMENLKNRQMNSYENNDGVSKSWYPQDQPEYREQSQQPEFPYKLFNPRRKKRTGPLRSLISNLNGPLGAFRWIRD